MARYLNGSLVVDGATLNGGQSGTIAVTSQIPSTSSFATRSWVQSQGYLSLDDLESYHPNIVEMFNSVIALGLDDEVVVKSAGLWSSKSSDSIRLVSPNTYLSVGQLGIIRANVQGNDYQSIQKSESPRAFGVQINLPGLHRVLLLSIYSSRVRFSNYNLEYPIIESVNNGGGRIINGGLSSLTLITECWQQYQLGSISAIVQRIG